jgi:hypothetical protein
MPAPVSPAACGITSSRRSAPATPLPAAGADPAIRDSRHDSDALGWARFFERAEIVRLLGG